jgi:hypothetical protein
MRWLLSIVIFAFLWGGMEVYHNTTLVRHSYAVQRLESRIETIEKESGSLKRKISSHLSLRELEDYARKELDLVEPKAVRYIKKESDGKKESPSFWIKIWNRLKELVRGDIFEQTE